MKAFFIQEPEQIDSQLHRLLPVFNRLPEVKEFKPEQLFELAKQNRVVIGYLEQDGEVVMAGAMEFINYPNMTSLNIIALAGSNLTKAHALFMDSLFTFARQAGATYIEALCHDPMARLLTKYGFNKSYTQMRIEV
ncbi:MAG: hypothetical protein CML16_17475 [Pusillimonas sp.]|nr:hypothetical protein [Pusillimonas sp.]HCP79686.1 hypothetical protein [Pusillimonas sp.]|tara:strand:- start:657 stop:1064 length:408 start_codon:yes stop_codon:yes gene_type:complete